MKYLTSLLALILAVGFTAQSQGSILYGVTSGPTQSAVPGSLYSIDQSNGAATFIGTPVPGAGLTGLVNMNGRLVASTNRAGGSRLIEIDPGTGALVGTLSSITFQGASAAVTDLAYNSNTGRLYGIGAFGPIGSNDRLVEIDPGTGAATLLGDSNLSGGFVSIGFSEDGSLYALANFGSEIYELDPSNASVIGSAPIGSNVGALGLTVDPATGDAFFSRGSAPWGNILYSVDPTAGGASAIGSFGPGIGIHDLAFIGEATVPEPASIAIWSTLALAGVGAARRRRKAA